MTYIVSSGTLNPTIPYLGCEETWRILRDKISVLTEKHIPIRSGNVNKSQHRDKWIQRQTVKEIIKDTK